LKGLKILKTVGMIGYVALVVSVVMDLWNMIADREVFSTALTLPFYAVALVGLVCDYVRIKKEHRENK
jgi:spore maturation protein SpmB